MGNQRPGQPRPWAIRRPPAGSLSESGSSGRSVARWPLAPRQTLRGLAGRLRERQLWTMLPGGLGNRNTRWGLDMAKECVLLRLLRRGCYLFMGDICVCFKDANSSIWGGEVDVCGLLSVFSIKEVEEISQYSG